MEGEAATTTTSKAANSSARQQVEKLTFYPNIKGKKKSSSTSVS
jgi:hypothetical protein